MYHFFSIFNVYLLFEIFYDTGNKYVSSGETDIDIIKKKIICKIKK